MIKVKINDETQSRKLRLKIRLDFRAEEQSGRFFFGAKTCETMAQTLREHQVSMFKHVPFQGVIFEDFDPSMDIYVVNEGDPRRTKQAAYAPLWITMRIEHIEDVFPFLIKPEFKKLEVLDPQNITMQKIELERLLFMMFKSFRREINEMY